MTLRIVHIGDLHLQSDHARNADRVTSLEQIEARALTGGPVDAWILPGDIFHTRSTAADRNRFAEAVQDLARTAPVVIVAGNHDAPGDLDIFGALRSVHGIHVATRPDVLAVNATGGDRLAILALPYAHKAGLASAGVAHTQLPGAAAQAFEPLLISLGAQLQAEMDAGALGLVALHQNIAGSVSSVGQPQIGAEIEYSTALLDRLPADAPILANHIHQHQAIPRSAGLPAVYAGSTSRHDFGEREAKGFVVWTHGADGWAWAFHEIEVPEQLHIEGRLTRAGFEFDHDDWMCRVCHGASDAPDHEGPCGACDGSGRRAWTGADIRVRYQVVKAEITALDTAAILAEFAGCRSLKLEAVPILETAVRAPEVAAAPTLPEKLAAYFRHAGLDWTPGCADKLDLLQQDTAERVVWMYSHDGAAPVQEVA